MKSMKLKKVLGLTMATAAVVSAVAVPGTAFAEEATGTLYYNFQEFTSVSQLTAGETYMFLPNQYSNDKAVVDLPTGSALLQYVGPYSEHTNYYYNRYDDGMKRSDGTALADGAVNVIRSGNNFDGCSTGTVGYENGKWYYGCSWGGASYVPLYGYTYDTLSFTSSDITATFKDSFVTKYTTQTVSADDLTVTVTVGGKSFDISYFTVDPSDNTVCSNDGDLSVTVRVGNVTATATTTAPEEHTYAKEYSTDETSHWYECTDENCLEPSDAIAKTTEEHTYEWVVDKAATTNETGLAHQVCTVCGYVANEGTEIPKVTHTYADADENGNIPWSTDATNHWHQCTEADCADLEGSVKDLSAHTFEWVVDKAATTSEAGVKHQECTVCGYKIDENTAIAKLASTNEDVSPKTADTSSAAVMFSVLCVSCIALAGTAVVAKKKH